MGSDSFGNNYYQSDYYMLGRSRWVEYAPTVKWLYDASQVSLSMTLVYGNISHLTAFFVFLAIIIDK